MFQSFPNHVLQAGRRRSNHKHMVGGLLKSSGVELHPLFNRISKIYYIFLISLDRFRSCL